MAEKTAAVLNKDLKAAWEGFKHLGPAFLGLVRLLDSLMLLTGALALDFSGLFLGALVALIARNPSKGLEVLENMTKAANSPWLARLLGAGVLTLVGAWGISEDLHLKAREMLCNAVCAGG